MPKVIFQLGEFFKFAKGYGVVIGKGKSLTIEGEGGRTGYITVSNNHIPEDAIPGTSPKFEVKFALDAVACSLVPGKAITTNN